jgi:hypothetical protein
MILHVENIQTLKVDNFYFIQMFFFLPNVHHSFFKLERILTFIIKNAQGFEVMKIVFITNLSTFGSKVFLTLKITNFENVSLTKVIHVHVIEGMNCIIYMI